MEISVVQNRDAAGGGSPFDVFIDGRIRATVELGKYYPPAIGVYEDERIAVWAGNRVAFGAQRGSEWSSVGFGKPVHAVYRIPSGWCVVTELTVLTVSDRGEVISEFGHREVISNSCWSSESLVLEDFEMNVLAVKIDDALMITATEVPNPGLA
jgi:hypothetical protein